MAVSLIGVWLMISRRLGSAYSLEAMGISLANAALAGGTHFGVLFFVLAEQDRHHVLDLEDGGR